MAVYKQHYKRYEGPLTSQSGRFTIISRYALKEIFETKLVLAFFTFSFVVPLAGAGLIYLHYNLDAMRALQLPLRDLIPINDRFFMTIVQIQTTFAFLMCAIIGPGLISPDLTNNAMPLYLSRPLTRRDYILGKFLVLALVLSAMSWIPSSLLFLFQTSLEGLSWFTENIRIGIAIVTGLGLWISVISLLALALSAWVKWRPMAAGLLFGVFFVGAGFGEAINQIMEFDEGTTSWGSLINLGYLIEVGLNWLFMGYIPGGRLPAWSVFSALLAVCGASLYLLARKIQAYEVVR